MAGWSGAGREAMKIMACVRREVCAACAWANARGE